MPDELNQVSALYAKWKQYGVEVVFVSLDEEEQVLEVLQEDFLLSVYVITKNGIVRP